MTFTFANLQQLAMTVVATICATTLLVTAAVGPLPIA